MQGNWPSCLKLFLRTEGGYVNDPKDPGGPTKYGVTLATARRYIDVAYSVARLKAMTPDEAGQVFKPQYWDKVAGDKLASGVDYTMGDYAINSGPSRPVKVLQALLNLPQTGKMDATTVVTAAQYEDADIVNGINDERMRFLKALPTFNHFGAGWTNRVNGVRAHSLEMAKGGAPTGEPSPFAAQYLDMAQQLPTGKAITEVDTGPQKSVAAGGASGLAALGVWWHNSHASGYLAMAIAFAMVAATAAIIAKLQKSMNEDATAPVAVVPIARAKPAAT